MRRRFLSWRIFGTIVLGAPTILAQSALSLDRFEPPAPGATAMTVADPGPSGGSPIRFGFVGSYADSPLILSNSSGSASGTTRTVVDSQWRLHWLASARLMSRWSVDMALPWVITESGSKTSSPNGRLFTLPASGMGDLRLGSRFVLMKPTGASKGTGVSGSVWLPSGDARPNADRDKVRYSFDLLTGADFGHWSLRVSLGRHRQWAQSLLPTLQSGWAFASAFAYRYRFVQVGPEVFGSTAVGEQSAPFARRSNHLEALLGVKLSWAGLVLGAAFGPGLTEGPGTPKYRAVLSVSMDPAYGHAIDKSSSRRIEGSVTTRASQSLATQTSQGARTSRASADGEVRSVIASPFEEKVLPVARDDDGDSIANYADACPAAYGIANNRQDKHGCPSDRDDDDIADAVDACPDIKGSASQDPKLNGCLELISVQGEQVVLSQQIQFATGGDVVLSESEPTLFEIEGLLRDHPEIVRVAVDGHTDSVGSAERNLALSRRRAISVVRWLVAHGVDERRLEARGFGPREPLATNATAAGRSQNRRVEFIIRKRSSEGAQAWREGSASDK